MNKCEQIPPKQKRKTVKAKRSHKSALLCYFATIQTAKETLSVKLYPACRLSGVARRQTLSFRQQPPDEIYHEARHAKGRAKSPAIITLSQAGHHQKPSTMVHSRNTSMGGVLEQAQKTGLTRRSDLWRMWPGERQSLAAWLPAAKSFAKASASARSTSSNCSSETSS